MNKPVFENQRELNCKKTIVILSIISLICEVLSFIPYFVACYWVDGKAYYQLVQYTSARSFIFMILNTRMSSTRQKNIHFAKAEIPNYQAY